MRIDLNSNEKRIYEEYVSHFHMFFLITSERLLIQNEQTNTLQEILLKDIIHVSSFDNVKQDSALIEASSVTITTTSSSFTIKGFLYSDSIRKIIVHLVSAYREQIHVDPLLDLDAGGSGDRVSILSFAKAPSIDSLSAQETSSAQNMLLKTEYATEEVVFSFTNKGIKNARKNLSFVGIFIVFMVGIIALQTPTPNWFIACLIWVLALIWLIKLIRIQSTGPATYIFTKVHFLILSKTSIVSIPLSKITCIVSFDSTDALDIEGVSSQHQGEMRVFYEKDSMLVCEQINGVEYPDLVKEYLYIHLRIF